MLSSLIVRANTKICIPWPLELGISRWITHRALGSIAWATVFFFSFNAPARDLSNKIGASAHAGYAQSSISTDMTPDSTGGFAFGLQLSWAWNNSFAITGAGEMGFHPDHTFHHPGADAQNTPGPQVRDLRTFGTLVGLTYFLDIYDIVPYITLGGCADWYTQQMFFPTISGPPKRVPQSGVELGVAAEGGLDVKISSHFSAALVARISTYLTHSSYYEGKTALFFRVTYRLDARNLWPWGRSG